MNDQLQSVSTMGLRGRLFAGFGMLVAILLVSIGISLYKTTSAENHAKRVINQELPAYDTLVILRGQVRDTQYFLSHFLITHETEYKTAFNLAWENVEHTEAQLNKLSLNWSDDVTQKYQNLKTLMDKMKTLENKILQDANGAAALTTELKPLTEEFFLIINGSANQASNVSGGLLNIFFTKVSGGSRNIIQDLDALRYMQYGLLVLGILAAILISFYTSHSILHYINIFRSQSKRIASGDLTKRVAVSSHDEMGMLGEDLNNMTERLSNINKQITESCHNMVSMLTEVKHAVDSQSAGASEQASSINQITASLEEIEKSAAQTMQKAKALGEVAERTRTKGELGLDAVEQSINGMKNVRNKVQTIAQTILDLSNQTQQVGEITAAVNTLAQQSKMLALNASIEAAKAGEAGKGFAVVAAEVKNLAEQSEQSTTQVQKILEDIRHATEKAVMAMEEGTKGVDAGTSLVEQTGEIVRSLNDVIHEATIASQQIEAAIRQEGIGIEQITAGMNEINQVTSSSVASVKQTTEAIDNLGSIANTLKKQTDVYKVT